MSVTTTITNAAIAKPTPMNIETETIGDASYEKRSPGQVELKSIGANHAATLDQAKTRIPNYIPTNSQLLISQHQRGSSNISYRAQLGERLIHAKRKNFHPQ